MRITSKEILNDPIQPVLIRMMVPMIIGIFFSFLFTAVDTWFISLLGTTELAAISFAAPVIFLVLSAVIGISVALGILVGKVIGQGNIEKAARITSDSLLFGLVFTLIVSTIGYMTIDPLFRALGATDNTLPYIHEYMDIWFLYTALLVIPMLANSALRATGDTLWASIIMMAGGLINVALDPILIFGAGPIEGMGISGAAYATVISWLFTFVLGMLVLGVREKLIVFSLPPLSSLLENWRNMMKLGIPIALANAMLPITIAILTALMASHGEFAVAAFGAGGRVESFAVLIPMAATAALSPFIAQNVGAENYQRAHQAFVITLKMMFKVMLVAWLVLFVFAGPLAGIFSDDEQVLSVSKSYLQIMPIGAIMYGMFMIFNTAFNAHYKSNLTLLSSVARLAIFIVPCAWVGNQLYGIIGLYIGCIVGNAMSIVLAWTLYTKKMRTA